MRAGPDLDVFAFRYVFDGLIEWETDARGETRLSRPIPSFSRRAEAAKILMVRIVTQSPGMKLVVTHGIEELELAKLAGHTLRTDKGPMWRVNFNKFDGFGKRFEEALTKMAIEMKKADLL